MGVQRNQRTCRPNRARTFDHLSNQVLMPAMNAIERADGQDRGAIKVNNVEVADDFHCRL